MSDARIHALKMAAAELYRVARGYDEAGSRTGPELRLIADELHAYAKWLRAPEDEVLALLIRRTADQREAWFRRLGDHFCLACWRFRSTPSDVCHCENGE